MFEVYMGCYEWQQSEKFSTLAEAQKYVDSYGDDFSMGLYSAIDVWIENLETGDKIVIVDIEDEESE